MAYQSIKNIKIFAALKAKLTNLCRNYEALANMKTKSEISREARKYRDHEEYFKVMVASIAVNVNGGVWGDIRK